MTEDRLSWGESPCEYGCGGTNDNHAAGCDADPAACHSCGVNPAEEGMNFCKNCAGEYTRGILKGMPTGTQSRNENLEKGVTDGRPDTDILKYLDYLEEKRRRHIEENEGPPN